MSIDPRAEDSRTMRKKWGSEVAAAGFTALPNHLIGANQFLSKDDQFSPTEMIVLLQILTGWWVAERMPFPSKSTIGKRAGLSPRQVQRALASLESKRVINKIVRYNQNRGRSSNAYDLMPLVSKIRSLVLEYPNAFKRGSVSSYSEKQSP